MLQKASVTAFTFFELLKKNQQGRRGEGGVVGGGERESKIFPPPRLGLMHEFF